MRERGHGQYKAQFPGYMFSKAVVALPGLRYGCDTLIMKCLYYTNLVEATQKTEGGVHERGGPEYLHPHGSSLSAKPANNAPKGCINDSLVVSVTNHYETFASTK